MNDYVERLERAEAILQLVASGDLRITHVSASSVQPVNGTWWIMVTIGGSRRLTVTMEGRNIRHVSEMVDTDGRHLIQQPITLDEHLTMVELAQLTEALLDAQTHVRTAVK